MKHHCGIALALIVVALTLACADPAPPSDDRERLNVIAEAYGRGDLDTAIPQLREYLADYPKDDLAWTILGNAYEDGDRLDEARAAYDLALEIDPERFEAITGTGILHRKRGEYEQAMAAYRRALEIDPTYAQAYSSMTVIALKQERDREAVEYAEKGWELDPEDPAIAANLAVAYHYVGDTEGRDRMTAEAERLGYTKVDVLRGIYAGELTVRD